LKNRPWTPQNFCLEYLLLMINRRH
jgi:hypothetical protein